VREENPRQFWIVVVFIFLLGAFWLTIAVRLLTE
jgi:hypothetical protein